MTSRDKKVSLNIVSKYAIFARFIMQISHGES
jgi:hypothetical protein